MYLYHPKGRLFHPFLTAVSDSFVDAPLYACVEACEGMDALALKVMEDCLEPQTGEVTAPSDVESTSSDVKSASSDVESLPPPAHKPAVKANARKINSPAK